MDTKNIGNVGEDIAVKFLTDIGHIILERNYGTKHGEVDIISVDGCFLVFTEVKTRATKNYGVGAEAVNFNKQRHIVNTAYKYIDLKKLYDVQVRFDVISIELMDGVKINHIVDAFVEC